MHLLKQYQVRTRKNSSYDISIYESIDGWRCALNCPGDKLSHIRMLSLPRHFGADADTSVERLINDCLDAISLEDSAVLSLSLRLPTA